MLSSWCTATGTQQVFSNGAASLQFYLSQDIRIFIEEINALGIPDLHVDKLYVLQGSFINQPYNINENEVKLLDDNATYWGNQIVKDDNRCYGIACCEKFILVSEYGKDGADAELVILKRR